MSADLLDDKIKLLKIEIENAYKNKELDENKVLKYHKLVHALWFEVEEKIEETKKFLKSSFADLYDLFCEIRGEIVPDWYEPKNQKWNEE